ncbi:MAG: methyltransferase domain-containing protein [Anaerolineales bacterium]|nr:methyltransferase domain-containing protein [Anaerolineales bacterium]
MSEQDILPPYAEGEVIDGLKSLAITELDGYLQGKLKFKNSTNPEAIPIRLKGDWGQLVESRLLTAVYVVQPFAIPRPKSLLGHENWQLILDHIATIREEFPATAFRTFRISAAGSDSAVFQRLKEQLAADTGLTLDEEEADLLVRIRRDKAVWEVLIRLTPRPLGTRPWRVANMPGALSGPLAAAVNLLTDPQPNDHYLNIMCGSSSILVERLGGADAAVAVGVDLNPEALQASQQNLAAAGVSAALVLADGMQLPFRAASFDALTADLPWGQLVGSHEQNEWLYPAVLAEAARVTRPYGRFVIITHEVQLMQETLDSFKNLWKVENELKLQQGNIRPRIYKLRRLN